MERLVSKSIERRRHPATLRRYSARVTNQTINREKDIEKLEIPKILKLYCKKHYLYDKFIKEDGDCPLSYDDFQQSFEQPFLNLTNDEFLTIMNWKYEVPNFAYDENHIKYIYYKFEFDDRRYCHNCMLNTAKNSNNGIYKVRCCDWILGEDIIDAMQCTDAWCDICTTSTLFWIEYYPFSVKHRWNPPDVELYRLRQPNAE